MYVKFKNYFPKNNFKHSIMTDNQSNSSNSQQTSNTSQQPIPMQTPNGYIKSSNLNSLLKPFDNNNNNEPKILPINSYRDGRNLGITNNHVTYIGDQLKNFEKKIDQLVNKCNNLEVQDKSLHEKLEKIYKLVEPLSKKIDDNYQKESKSFKDLNSNVNNVHNYIKSQNISITSTINNNSNNHISSITKESKNINSNIEQIKKDISEYNKQITGNLTSQGLLKQELTVYNQQFETYQEYIKDIFEQNEQLLIYQKSKEQLEQLEQFKLLLSEINNSVQDFKKNLDIPKKDESKPTDIIVEKRKSLFQNRRIVSPPSSAIPPSSSNSNSDCEDTDDERPLSEFVIQKKAKAEMKKRPVRKIICTKCGIEGHTVNNCPLGFSPKIINRKKETVKTNKNN
jgi:uncharacterized coiled-coil DUF342 family protein